MTGNKAMVRFVTIFVLMLCMLLSGCSQKASVNGNNESSQESVGSTVADPTGATEVTSLITDEENETQNSTKPQENTTSDDGFTSKGFTPSIEPSETPADNSVATTPGNGNDGALNTEPSTVPTDSTTTTDSEKEDNNMPGYGIELPDDNWD